MNIEQIKDRCRIDEFTGCWLWTGAKSSGWPRIWAPDYTLHSGELRTQTGRRAVWHVKTGKPIPSGWRVFGTCQARNCVNPAHMICEPTAQQGQKVAASGKLKGNIRRITANRATGRKRSSLSPALIAEILESPETGLQLERRLGVSRTTVSRVRTRKALAFDAVGGLFSGLLAMNDATKVKRA